MEPRQSALVSAHTGLASPDRQRAVIDLFLADCVRRALGGAALPPWPGPAADAAAIAQRIAFHGIAALLAQCPGGPGDWPASVAEAIRQEARWRAVRNALTRKCLAELTGCLAENGVPCLILKGDALAFGTYADPALRPRSDSDLLIHPEHLARARTVLRQCGWSRTAPASFFPAQEDWLYQPGEAAAHVLDLHWQLSSRPVLNRALPVEFLWQDARPVPGFHPAVRAPRPVALLAHGALNQALHEHRGYHGMGAGESGGASGGGGALIAGKRLIWSCDYWLLARDFSAQDWHDLAAFAARQDMGAIIHAALAGAVADLAQVVPDGIMAQLLPAQGRSATLDFIRNTRILPELTADLRAAPSWRARLVLLINHALQTRASLQKKYPGSAHWPTLALQLRRYCDAVFGRAQP